MKPPIIGMKVTPSGGDNMQAAFVTHVCHCLMNGDCIEAFRAETGHDLNELVGRSAIDLATGRENAMVAGFADYVAENYWGKEGEA